jgi:phage regulator Rha-like protein
MAKRKPRDELARLAPLIRTIRGDKVILDSDLALIYGVTTARLNEQVKRNLKRFPEDFTFRLTRTEFEDLISQNATSSSTYGGRRKLPLVFTEHGAIMAANVLNSARAVEMSVYVVRAFVKMRSVLAEHKDLARELAEVERQLTERLDVHEAAIVEVLQRIMLLLDTPPPPPEPPRRRIGFNPKSTRRKTKLIERN